MSASNTLDCFRELIGLKVVAVLFDALPSGRADISRGTKTLVLDDGTGLTFSNNGSYWRETVEDVQTGIAARKAELSAIQGELREVMRADGIVGQAIINERKGGR